MGLPGPDAAGQGHEEAVGKEQPIIPVGSAPPPRGRDVVRVETAAESDRDD
jgi:hypothetical protein